MWGEGVSESIKMECLYNNIMYSWQRSCPDVLGMLDFLWDYAAYFRPLYLFQNDIDDKLKEQIKHLVKNVKKGEADREKVC